MTAMRDWRSALRSPWTVAAAALAARLLAMLILYTGPWAETLREFRFPSEMTWIAQSIATGHGFSSPLPVPSGPTAWTTPVFPYLLALVFRIFGVRTPASGIAILTLDSLFSALTCVAIFSLARRPLGERTALAAGWTWAVFPYAIYISVARVWDTTLTTLLAVGLVHSTLKLAESPQWGRWLLYGLLWGVAGMTNAPLLMALPFLGAWLAWQLHRHKVTWVRGATLSALVFALSVTPWFVRNARVFGRFIPFRDTFGLELRVGNGPETDVYWRGWLHPHEALAPRQRFLREGELAFMAEQRREATQFISSHPGRFAWLTLKRISYMWTGIWSLAPDYLLAKPEETVNIPFCTLLTLFGLAGLRLAYRRGLPLAWPFALVLFSSPLTFYITHVQIRYRHPLDPFLVILAAYYLVERSRRSHGGGHTRAE